MPAIAGKSSSCSAITFLQNEKNVYAAIYRRLFADWVRMLPPFKIPRHVSGLFIFTVMDMGA